MNEPRIRPIAPADVPAVARIYNHYVQHTIVTFEEQTVVEGEMRRRIEEVSGSSHPWLVAQNDTGVVGYAYSTQWRQRSAYRHTAETTVYLDPKHTGRGIGTKLYEALLTILRANEMHVAVAGISLPNPASVALHERFGFSTAALFQAVGFKFERWIDVGYWQLKL